MYTRKGIINMGQKFKISSLASSVCETLKGIEGEVFNLREFS